MKASYDRKCDSLMFSDNLSTSLLQLCDFQHLSYERAAERCNFSARYFGSIIRCRTAPTIVTLEKICTGFCVTPNDLLIRPANQPEQHFRMTMPVKQIRVYRTKDSFTAFPVCPQCGSTLEREYQSYCDRCGQCLDWSSFHKAAVLLPKE